MASSIQAQQVQVTGTPARRLCGGGGKTTKDKDEAEGQQSEHRYRLNMA